MIDKTPSPAWPPAPSKRNICAQEAETINAGIHICYGRAPSPEGTAPLRAQSHPTNSAPDVSNTQRSLSERGGVGVGGPSVSGGIERSRDKTSELQYFQNDL